MFLEKHEPATVEGFTWFNKEGKFIDSQDPAVISQLSKINRYIVEVNQHSNMDVPQFINWLFRESYTIYCVFDCRNDVKDMTNVQRILFEREKAKENWIPFESQNNIFFKKFTCLEEVELIWNTYLFFIKNSIEDDVFVKLFNEFGIISLGFPNLCFPSLLSIYKGLIVGKVSWGESYFKPGTNEEPVVLICYTAEEVLCE